MKDPKKPNTTVATNRRARYDYHILDTLEAGMVLVGSEVKSLRDGKCSLDGSYVSVQDGELWLTGVHIDEYKNAVKYLTYNPKQKRKLLVHKRERRRFAEKSMEKGLTIVPLSIYFNSKGIAKCEIAVVKGKKEHDKRQSEKTKSARREMRGENE